MKAIVSYLLCALISASTLEVGAQINFIPEQQVNHLLEQAKILSHQGVSKDEIVKIFEQSLVQEVVHQETVELNNSTWSKKTLLLIGAGCTVLVACGIVYILLQKESAKAKEAEDKKQEILAQERQRQEQRQQEYQARLQQIEQQRQTVLREIQAEERALDEQHALQNAQRQGQYQQDLQVLQEQLLRLEAEHRVRQEQEVREQEQLQHQANARCQQRLAEIDVQYNPRIAELDRKFNEQINELNNWGKNRR